MRMFSKRLKELRSHKRLSQEELSMKINIPRTTIAGYESGARSLPREERLKVFANFFGVSLDYLIGYSDEENETKELETQITQMIRNADLHYSNEYSYSDEEKEKIISLLVSLSNLPKDERLVALKLLSRMAKSTVSV